MTKRHHRSRPARCTFQTEMRFFDSLPAKIRAALNDSPEHYVLLEEWLLRFINQHGVDEAARLIREGKFGVKIDLPGN